MSAKSEEPFKRDGKLLLVADDVACLMQPIVNLYLIGPRRAGDRAWVLLDVGLPGLSGGIKAAAAERFGAGARPAAIVLTHGHFDHVGGLPALAEEWDAPIYAHALEFPYLTGRSAYPPPDPTVGGGMARLSPLYPAGPFDFGDHLQTLPDDRTFTHLPEWRILHTPGHAPGHVSLFRDSDRLLLAGDAFVTTRQESAVAALAKPRTVQGPPKYFTPDWGAARRSVEALAALDPATAATGHGVPLRGERLREQLQALAGDFDEVAVPPHGRYTDIPAVTDERGVVSVPPPAPDLAPIVAAGAVVAGAALLALRRSRSAHAGVSPPRPLGD